MNDKSKKLTALAFLFAALYAGSVNASVSSEIVGDVNLHATSS